MTGGEGSRLIGFVVDGKYTKFPEDPVQRDDPHATKPNQYQNVDNESWAGGDYTKIVFTGSERDVLQLYGAMAKATIEINNQDLASGLFGQRAPNSNSFNAEMKEKLSEMAEHLGIKIDEHNAGGWDIGSDFEMNTEEANPQTWNSIDDLRNYIDTLEKTAAEQLNTIKNNGVQTNLENPIPRPSF